MTCAPKQLQKQARLRNEKRATHALPPLPAHLGLLTAGLPAFRKHLTTAMLVGLVPSFLFGGLLSRHLLERRIDGTVAALKCEV